MVITDPIFDEHAERGWFHRLATRLINDERDVPFVRLMILQSVIFLPFAVLLYWPGMFRWYLAAAYLAAYLWFMGPFILMLHNTSHRRLFSHKYKWLNHYIPWVLSPIFGETPETYYAHHIGMHHPENNLFDDLSTTMTYQRDSFVDFLRYFFRFFFGALVELSVYMVRRKRFKMWHRMLLGEVGWYAVVALGLLLNWQATLVVLVIPFCFTRWMMMAGNWGQHAFVDAADPNNPHRNSITCINAAYNQRCFNDGYHIGHHVTANRHWTEMPGDFLNNRAAYAKDDAICFEGLDFFMVWFYLMLKRYDWLVDRFVQLDPKRAKSREEILALMHERLKKIPEPEVQLAAA